MIGLDVAMSGNAIIAEEGRTLMPAAPAGTAVLQPLYVAACNDNRGRSMAVPSRCRTASDDRGCPTGSRTGRLNAACGPPARAAPD